MTAGPIDEILRHEGGQVLATLIGLTGDFDLAEDALQDAVVAALESWPAAMPDKPGAWLTTVARRSAIDRMRREARRNEKEDAAAALLTIGAEPTAPDSAVADDVLRLIFTCCHPALAPEAQIALTLRTVCRLTTAQIAALFLVREPTMAQRISRTKKKIETARIPYRVPPDHELPDRVARVNDVVYAVFTAGHHASSGDAVVDVDVAAEAVRLARLVVDLLGDDPECVGLLALLLATHARAATRVDAAGDVVLLEDQDRGLWDRAAIAEAGALVDQALRRRRPGPFQIKAAIACLHGLAATWEATDWQQIAELYRLLERFEPTAVVRVNRAVAEAYAEGPAAGLELLDGLADVDEWHLYWSTRGELLRRLGRAADAAACFARALECSSNAADRRLLERRLAEVSAST